MVLIVFRKKKSVAKQWAGIYFEIRLLMKLLRLRDEDFVYILWLININKFAFTDGAGNNFGMPPRRTFDHSDPIPENPSVYFQKRRIGIRWNRARLGGRHFLNLILKTF